MTIATLQTSSQQAVTTSNLPHRILMDNVTAEFEEAAALIGTGWKTEKVTPPPSLSRSAAYRVLTHVSNKYGGELCHLSL